MKTKEQWGCICQASYGETLFKSYLKFILDILNKNKTKLHVKS